MFIKILRGTKQTGVEKDIQTILTRELMVLNYLKIRQTDGHKALQAMHLQGIKL
jgi:hypothetical protein